MSLSKNYSPTKFKHPFAYRTLFSSLFIVLNLCDLGFTNGFPDNSYYLSNFCNEFDELEQTIPLDRKKSSVAFLSMYKNNPYSLNATDVICDVDVSGEPGSQLYLIFLKVSLPCQVDEFLNVHNHDPNGPKSFRVCGEEVCKNESCPLWENVTDSEMSLSFYRNTSEAIKRLPDFLLMITAFDNAISGKCPYEGQFLCNNGRCISPFLRCDGRNNCGDNSDETGLCPAHHEVTTTDTVWGIIIIGFGILSTITLLPCFIYMAYKGGQTQVITLPDISKVQPQSSLSINDPDAVTDSHSTNTTWYGSDAPSSSQTQHNIYPGVTSDSVHLVQP